MQTKIEKLRLIADAIEQGKQIEIRFDGLNWASPIMSLPTKKNDLEIYDNAEYRIKPDKPRTHFFRWTQDAGRQFAYESVELTPEVRKALEDAGIEI